MKTTRLAMVALSALMAVLLPTAWSQAGNGHDEDETARNVVRWHTIIGLAVPGSQVGTISPFGAPPVVPPIFPIFVEDGRAWVHLQTGRMKFSVRGLALANSTALAVAGTTGVISEVKGTLVCNGTAGVVSEYADTSAIPLSPQGNAEFVGTINIPTACHLTPDKLAFLIRVANVSNPSATAQVGRWIAVGVVRIP